MEYLFKKYLWVVHLGLVMLIGWFIGHAVSDYAVRQKLKVPFISMKDLDDRMAAARNEQEAKAPGEENASELLKARNVFNTDRFTEVPVEEEPVEAEEGPLDVGAGSEFEEANLNATLVGTMVGKRADDSLALVKDGAVMRLVRTGMTVADSAQVLAIEPKYMVVKVGGKVQVLKMGAVAAKAKAGPLGAAGRPGAAGHTPAPEAGGPAAAGADNYDAWVHRTAANEFQLDRASLMNELNDLSKLGMQARIVPNYKGGKYEGFKLIGVRPNSLYRAIGIRSGDIVKGVNGSELDSPNKAIKLFDELKNESSITVDVERGGRPMQLFYKVR
jgi:general secretion pathway protein C